MQETSSPATPLPAARARPTLAIFSALIAIGCIILTLAGYGRPVAMGIVQGLGEFLPISSSAHLILVPWFFGWQNDPSINSLTFDVALHLGTLVALLGYFWRDWMELLRAVPGLFTRRAWSPQGDAAPERTASAHILGTIVVATIPGAIAGVLLDNLAEQSLRAPLLIAATLAILGLLLYLADRLRPEEKRIEQISWRDALLIGLAQACALVPGVSRSGGTITMGRLLAFERTAAARYSFLLSAPITAAAVLFKLKDILRIPPSQVGVFVVGVLVSGAVGALAIGFLLNYIRRAGFGLFAVYRVALALVIVLVYILR
jgi:undecaprenyl-diphosphatase